MSKRVASSLDPRSGADETSVVVFCGGRGSASIARAWLQSPNCRLTLLVNAYDDGLSTGRLRGFVPGMLGASDFRKNLSRLLEMSSPSQFAVADLLEYRFPTDAGLRAVEAVVASFAATARGRNAPRWVAARLTRGVREQLTRLDADTAGTLHAQLDAFVAYAGVHDQAFAIADCALGNLLLVGAYLACGRSFNAAVAQLARAFHSRAEVINVTTGENRILVALKADGEVMARESLIVAPQSRAPIRALYLLPELLSADQLAQLAECDVEGRAVLLASWHREVDLSVEARVALERAGVVVYGPGTQHSSLLPSYITRGLATALAAGRARHRVFVVNLRDDCDTQGVCAADLVDRALEALGDATNASRLVTEILVPRERRGDDSLAAAVHRGARVIVDDFENPAVPGVHNGARVVERINALLLSPSLPADEGLDVYVDLHQRSIAVESVIQEFAERPWGQRCAHAHLSVNSARFEPVAWPEQLSLSAARFSGLFSEVEMLLTWLRHGRSRFLASLTGDGEYRLRDIEMCMDLLRTRRFGVILGARNQSKEQFFGSLRDAYASKRLMYAASVAGGFGVAVMCGVRFGLILSDPLTGFRVYDRLSLPGALCRDLIARPPHTTLEVTARLVDHGVEIAEVPVFYHSYPGFTDERWRLVRGLVNAVSVLR